jgi:hypothetical protein
MRPPSLATLLGSVEREVFAGERGMIANPAHLQRERDQTGELQ